MDDKAWQHGHQETSTVTKQKEMISGAQFLSPALGAALLTAKAGFPPLINLI